MGYFECEIQARLRDVNLAGHVDNVEAIRVIDEARQIFVRFGSGEAPALFRDLPQGVTDLVAAQRVDYHAEMRFAPAQPFLVRLWVGHIGRSSFTISTEVRTAPDHPAAIVAESTLVMFDATAGRSWAIDDTLRSALGQYVERPVELRERPTR